MSVSWIRIRESCNFMSTMSPTPIPTDCCAAQSFGETNTKPSISSSWFSPDEEKWGRTRRRGTAALVLTLTVSMKTSNTPGERDRTEPNNWAKVFPYTGFMLCFPRKSSQEGRFLRVDVSTCRQMYINCRCLRWMRFWASLFTVPISCSRYSIMKTIPGNKEGESNLWSRSCRNHKDT